MRRRTVLSLVVLLGLVIWGSVAEAGDGSPQPRLGLLRLFRSPPPTRPADHPADSQVQPPRQNPYSYWRDIYPQYYGGFHYRQIYEFGPPGDFGFRGYPW